MLALAQALVARPRFILADEMSLGLAPVIVRRLMAVVKAAAAAGRASSSSSSSPTSRSRSPTPPAC